MFGAVFGDVIGSYYELHCTKDYNFLFHKDSCFTDDSVLTAAVCSAILDNPSEISFFKLHSRAYEYAAKYRQFYSRFPDAGFGNMFSSWAMDYEEKFIKSYANGGAMRVIPIGWAYNTLEQTLLQAKASCIPSHGHKDAIKCTKAVAAAVFLARNGKSKSGIKKYLEDKFCIDLSASVSDLRQDHIFNSTAMYSVPAAICCFLESSDYESAVRNAVSLGGDADTEACIAGGIAEAFYGTIPEHIHSFCLPRLDVSIKNTVREFYKEYCVH